MLRKINTLFNYFAYQVFFSFISVLVITLIIIGIILPKEEYINFIFDSPKAIAILLLVCVPIIWWKYYLISKPLQELELAINAVACGNLSEKTQLENSGIAELRAAGVSFNQMLRSLQQLRNYQQRLISDISHELKTPLARIQLALSLLRHRNSESSEILRIEDKIQKLDLMIQNMLSLSSENLKHIQSSVFVITDIWEQVLNDAKFEFTARGYQLLITHYIANATKYRLNGNQSLLAHAVENVLRNAKKYATSKIKFMTFIKDKQLYITIDDDGLGVPDDQYEAIFRPFYRVGNDRARQTGGTGLGLAIVADAVKYHHGLVYAEKSPLGGLRVIIQLPLYS